MERGNTGRFHLIFVIAQFVINDFYSLLSIFTFYSSSHSSSSEGTVRPLDTKFYLFKTNVSYPQIKIVRGRGVNYFTAMFALGKRYFINRHQAFDRM